MENEYIINFDKNDIDLPKQTIKHNIKISQKGKSTQGRHHTPSGSGHGRTPRRGWCMKFRTIIKKY